MILLFDIGNTRIKYAKLIGQDVVAGETASHNNAYEWSQMLERVSGIPEAIYLACVAGEAIEEKIRQWCSKKWGIDPMTLTSEQRCGEITNGYTTPSDLGIDRWAAIIGAYQCHKRALVVVDCGTACTVDVIDAQGRHIGGAIAPGLNMLRMSLHAGTSRIAIPESDAESPPNFGTSTVECIAYGVTESLAAFIERMAEQAKAVLHDEVQVILTGGDAPYLLSRLKIEATYEESLVFMGLAGIVSDRDTRL